MKAKKVAKIIGLVLLIIIVLMVGVMIYLNKKPAAPKNYQKVTKTGGEIEAYYMKNGPYEVSVKEEPVLLGLEKFMVYYPTELESNDEKWPVIVICNGSGTPLSKYTTVAKHYASWGFIVIGTEEKYAWDGSAAEMSIRYLERWNENESIESTKSIFYQKVDFENVGIVGHSQGGVGVINAITATEHKEIYKAAVSLSPTNGVLAHNLMWDYDAGKIEIPIFIISGEGGGDDWVITGEQLENLYNEIHSQKIATRRVNTVHNEVLYTPDGYIMAWFMWQLKGDENAAKAFTGNAPELMTNEMYINQMFGY